MLGIGGAAALLLASDRGAAPAPRRLAAFGPARADRPDRGFVILYASFVLLSAALFVPFVFIKSYATDEGIADGPAAALVGIIGASSVVGRLGLGALGSRFGATTLMQASFATMAASFAIWLVAGDRYPLLVAFAVVMGVAYGGFIALAPAVTAGLFGTLGLGGVLGALYTAAGIGGLVGPPVIGVVIDASSYETGIAVAMTLSAASTVVLRMLPAEAR